MKVFACVDTVTGTVREKRSFDQQPPDLPGKGWVWRPVEIVGAKDFDAATQVRTGPVVTIEADRVVETYAARDRTADEIDNEIDSEIGPVLKIMFAMQNEIRDLQGKPALTARQFRAAVRATL